MNLTRRGFFRSVAAAAALSDLSRPRSIAPAPNPLPLPHAPWRVRSESAFTLGLRTGTVVPYPLPAQAVPRQARARQAPFDWSAAGDTLRRRFRDLRRHFVFEYYPWYANDPWRHWDQWDRRPPIDIAATSMPLLGPYDSRSRATLERHARWIAESGVGAINLSWWGPDSFEDRAVPLIMDVMHDHDIHVTFHLEPYRDNRVEFYATDILYLLREYGEKRRWDAFLLLEDADGAIGPVFKSFRTIVPREATDCHGNTSLVPDWVPDPAWRQQTDRVRSELGRQFDHIRLLADVSDFARLTAAGFDGMAIYDNYVRPESWRSLAQACQDRNVLFSFNANPGFDGIHLRTVEPDSCYVPSAFEPPSRDELEWTRSEDREAARRLAQERINESLRATLRLQLDNAYPNARRGFFLTFINSFNEWHEGHQFEPMKDGRDLTESERRFEYRNPSAGDYRLRYLSALLDLVLD
jgi:Glycosyl hydrolase family 99